MPYRPDDSAFDTDDSFARLAPDTASPRDLFYALTAQGVPPQQAMTAAYARDSDVLHATLQAYGRPTVIPNAPLSSLTEIPVVDTRLPPADFSRGQVVQPTSARGASVFPDPPYFPPQTDDDAMRRRPGFIPRADGGDNLGPGYLNPRSEVERRSRWAARDSSRESLGLPPDSTDQFAGVNLGRGADGGYGLDPHYAAQTQRALDTEPYVPTQRERIVRGGKFYAGAAPFGFAGPGSLNFDPSLEANTETLAPFRRPFTERGPLDALAKAYVESPAYQASLQPEAADHGRSERQRRSALGSRSTSDEYFETALRIGREGREQMSRGWDQFRNSDDPWTRAEGVGNFGMGLWDAALSPVSAALRTEVTQPLEDVVGLPREILESGVRGASAARTIAAVPGVIASIPGLIAGVPRVIRGLLSR
ncbi:hypothetical protein [Bradyrhizobium prioriisuperbiae]|uniref:hypothetical protein n=1 Tax=Bradyrhizobium prioriisuperbiae TaxID=2854389 RepID=UPI0028E25E9A|nr:hypothetical protein [Bradyrhizobium prioritasuperba]